MEIAPLKGLAPGPRAFEAMVREHVPVLQQIARGFCRDPSEAHDLLQDAQERALRSFGCRKVCVPHVRQDIPKATVGTRLMRARLKLRERLLPQVQDEVQS